MSCPREKPQWHYPQERRLSVSFMSFSKESALTDVIIKKEKVLSWHYPQLRKLISSSEKAPSESIFSRERTSNDVLPMEERLHHLGRKPFKGFLLPTTNTDQNHRNYSKFEYGNRWWWRDNQTFATVSIVYLSLLKNKKEMENFVYFFTCHRCKD